MSGAVELRLARLRRLPLRLRIAHLAALARSEQGVNGSGRFLSYPSTRVAVGRGATAERWSGGGRAMGVQLLGTSPADPHPVAHCIRADPLHKGEGKEGVRICDHSPRKGEGSDLSNGSRKDGRRG